MVRGFAVRRLRWLAVVPVLVCGACGSGARETGPAAIVPATPTAVSTTAVRRSVRPAPPPTAIAAAVGAQTPSPPAPTPTPPPSPAATAAAPTTAPSWPPADEIQIGKNYPVGQGGEMAGPAPTDASVKLAVISARLPGRAKSGVSFTVAARVTAAPGYAGTPTGSVQFVVGDGNYRSIATVPLHADGTASATLTAPIAKDAYRFPFIWADYQGDGVFQAITYQSTMTVTT